MSYRKNEEKLAVWKSIFCIILLMLDVTLIYHFLCGQQGFIEYIKIYKRNTEINEAIKRIDKENHSLTNEISMLQVDGPELERAIRKNLNFVKDNEIVYFFVQDKSTKGSLQQ